MAGHHNQHGDESRRIIDRISNEDGGMLGRAAGRLQNHLNATDADKDDPIEKMGMRIGRTIGLGVTLVVVAWALTYLFAR